MLHRSRTKIAALAALLLGLPLSERLFAQGFGIAWDALNLGFSVADASAGES